MHTSFTYASQSTKQKMGICTEKLGCPDISDGLSNSYHRTLILKII